MALPFAYFFLYLFYFFPSMYFSCPDSSCGHIKIQPPFFPNTTDPLCTRKYMIQCEDNSKPVIKFNDHEYPVKDISYQEKVLILQDQALGGYLLNGHCGFLYNFSDPIHNFHIPAQSPFLSFENSSGCEGDFDAISRAFFPMRNDSHHYTLYYWDDESSQQPTSALPSNCLAAEPTLFEWVLSFSQDDGPLSLRSAGFSRRFVLRDDCFYCKVTGQSCSCSNGTGDHSCLCEDICKTNKGSSSRKNRGIVIGSVVGAGFLLVFLPLALYFHRRRKVSMSIIFLKKNINNSQRNIEAFLDEYGSLAPKRYRYSDVKKITKAFREKLGQGGYGTVFKGTLSNGKVVAVKILNDSKDVGDDFINEVASIGRTSHVNVVNLLGFCSEGSKRALIYEFMCNGSLEKLIYSEKPKTILDWENLYQIVRGIARGLEYLHRGCNTRIVHFDIKPHNILLDQDFCPKISDFGLAKLCLKKDSLISIAGARGTIGYIAPEVFSRNFGIVSSKSDVYSYGMMVLEIAGGKKNMHVGVENSSETYFPHWIYEHLDQNGDLLAYGVAAESEETVRKMILIGLWCIQTMPQNRPSMSRVIEMLEGSINDLQVPPKPYLSSSPLGSLIGTSSIQDICWDDSSSLVHS